VVPQAVVARVVIARITPHLALSPLLKFLVAAVRLNLR
jgi:hypothetical protein